MIKLSNQTGRVLLFALEFLKKNDLIKQIDTLEERDRTDLLFNEWGTRELGNRIWNFVDRETDLAPEEKLTEIASQIESQLAGGGDVEIVEDIARIIGTRHQANILSGQTLRQLRGAILRPDEHLKLQADLGKGFSCGICGHPLKEAELTTFNLDETGLPRLTCANCVCPEYVACGDRGCQNHAVISGRVRDILANRKARCNEHGEKKKGEEKTIVAGDVGAAWRILRDRLDNTAAPGPTGQTQVNVREQARRVFNPRPGGVVRRDDE